MTVDIHTRMGSKIPKHDWMKKYLGIITEIGNKVKDSGPTNDYGCYTSLKLISVLYYAAPFLQVATKPERADQGYDGAVYIELFAGSGLVKLTDTGDLVGGSPLCAVSSMQMIFNKNQTFKYVVCIEKDPVRKKALEERLEKVLPKENFAVIGQDCNKCIQEVINLIQKRFNNPIVLTFVDPEGMEIKWSTLETLSKAFAAQDFIINVSSSGAARVRGKLEKGDKSVEKTWNEYWGDQDAQVLLSELAEGKKIEQKYQEKIKEILGKPMGDTIPIRETKNNIAYHILGYTRETAGGSGYARVFTALKKKIEKEDRDSVRRMLDVIHNRTKTF